MATTFSMLKIINAALLAHGQETVSENDGSLEWRTLSDNWASVVEAELEDGNYAFTKNETAVSTYVSGKFGFLYGYAVPSSALHVRNVWLVDPSGVRRPVDWCQDSAYVYIATNTGCTMEWVEVTDPSVWSANFSRGIQLMMEAIVLRAMKEEYKEARDAEDKAIMYLQRARSKSSSSRAKRSPFFDAGSLAGARMRRGTI